MAHRKLKTSQELPVATKIPSKYSYENMMKHHATKHASIQFRNDLLKAKARASYQNEYNRVNSILLHHILNQSHPDYQRLVDRREHLKKLAAGGLYPQHELYQSD